MKIRPWVALFTSLAVVAVVLKDIPLTLPKTSSDACLSCDSDAENDLLKDLAADVPRAAAPSHPGLFWHPVTHPQQACEPVQPLVIRSGPRAPPLFS